MAISPAEQSGCHTVDPFFEAIPEWKDITIHHLKP
jgi:hypothetical protein